MTPAELAVYAAGHRRRNYRADVRSARIIRTIMAYSGNRQWPENKPLPELWEIAGYKAEPKL